MSSGRHGALQIRGVPYMGGAFPPFLSQRLSQGRGENAYMVLLDSVL